VSFFAALKEKYLKLLYDRIEFVFLRFVLSNAYLDSFSYRKFTFFSLWRERAARSLDLRVEREMDWTTSDLGHFLRHIPSYFREVPVFFFFGASFCFFLLYSTLWLTINGNVFLPTYGTTGWSWVSGVLNVCSIHGFGFICVGLLATVYDEGFGGPGYFLWSIRDRVNLFCLRLCFFREISKSYNSLSLFSRSNFSVMKSGDWRVDNSDEINNPFVFLDGSIIILDNEDKYKFIRNLNNLYLIFLEIVYPIIFKPHKLNQQIRMFELRTSCYNYPLTRLVINELGLFANNPSSFMRTPEEQASIKFFGKHHLKTYYAFANLRKTDLLRFKASEDSRARDFGRMLRSRVL
jgi:hypothetical protein